MYNLSICTVLNLLKYNAKTLAYKNDQISDVFPGLLKK